MTDFVEIQDDVSDCGQEENNGLMPIKSGSKFIELKKLKQEMEFRGSLLGKTWSELSHVMTRYQTQLIHKHEQFEAIISASEHERLVQLESTIDKKTQQLQRLEKTIFESEQKLLEKDTEIVRLRTEVHKLRNEVSMKDRLIEKLQNQMARESMEYQTEISSLKEAIEMETSAKRRRIGALSQVPAQSHAPSPSSEGSMIYPSSRFGHSSHAQLSTEQTHESEMGSESTYSDNQIINESHESQEAEQDAFYEHGEGEEDASNSGDVTSDLDQQLPDVKPQALIQNIHSGPRQSSSQNSQRSTMIVPKSKPILFNALDSTPVTWIYHSEKAEMEATESMPYQPRGMKQYMCPFCGRQFRWKLNLDDHVRVHLGIKPFLCRLCGQTSATRGNMYSHLLVVHKMRANRAQFIIVQDKDGGAIDYLNDCPPDDKTKTSSLVAAPMPEIYLPSTK